MPKLLASSTIIIKRTARGKALTHTSRCLAGCATRESERRGLWNRMLLGSTATSADHAINRVTRLRTNRVRMKLRKENGIGEIMVILGCIDVVNRQIFHVKWIQRDSERVEIENIRYGRECVRDVVYTHRYLVLPTFQRLDARCGDC